MSRITIRQARMEDHEVIVAFNRALAQESEGLALDQATLAAGVRRQLEDPMRGRYWIAERTETGEDAAAVGQLAVTTEWSDWRNGYFWWIQSVYVHPGSRRKGVFRALYRRVAFEARAAADCCGLRLYVEPANEAAIASYHAAGLVDAPYRMLELDFTDPPRTRT